MSCEGRFLFLTDKQIYSSEPGESQNSGKDDRITERNRTLAYFKDNSILRYRDFVEDIGHKYVVQEHEIKKSMEEDELWLPW